MSSAKIAVFLGFCSHSTGVPDRTALLSIRFVCSLFVFFTRFVPCRSASFILFCFLCFLPPPPARLQSHFHVTISRHIINHGSLVREARPGVSFPGHAANQRCEEELPPSTMRPRAGPSASSSTSSTTCTWAGSSIRSYKHRYTRARSGRFSSSSLSKRRIVLL